MLWLCPDVALMSAQAEADLAAALYVELADFRAAAERRGVSVGGCEVGIVTPYKQQKACLRDTFLRAVGPEASSKVRIHSTSFDNLCWRVQASERCDMPIRASLFLKCMWQGDDTMSMSERAILFVPEPNTIAGIGTAVKLRAWTEA